MISKGTLNNAQAWTQRTAGTSRSWSPSGLTPAETLQKDFELVIKVDFSEKVKEEISKVINVFETTVKDNIHNISIGFINQFYHFIAKTRENLGRGLLKNLQIKIGT